MQCDAVVVEVENRPVIPRPDLPQSLAKKSFEIVHAPIIRAKLLLERRPCDEGWFRRRYPVQPLRQPAIEIDCKGRVSKRRKIGLIERYSVLLQAVEVISRKLDGRRL